VRRLIHTLSVFGLALVLGSLALAEEKKEDKKPADSIAKVFSFPKQITLTDEQKTKLADLQKEYTPKLEEAAKKHKAIMTPEREKTAAEAHKKAVADGKKGKEVQAAVNEALKLSKEEQEQLKEGHHLMGEINKKKMGLLTAEQKEQLKPKPKEAKPTDK